MSINIVTSGIQTGTEYQASREAFYVETNVDDVLANSQYRSTNRTHAKVVQALQVTV